MHEHHKRRTFVGRQASAGTGHHGCDLRSPRAAATQTAYAKLTSPYLQSRRPCFGDANTDARTSAFNMSKRCGFGMQPKLPNRIGWVIPRRWGSILNGVMWTDVMWTTKRDDLKRTMAESHPVRER
jgi:hypothetical protein